MEKIIAHIKEKQKEYQEGSAAHNVLRDLECTLPGLFAPSEQEKWGAPEPPYLPPTPEVQSEQKDVSYGSVGLKDLDLKPNFNISTGELKNISQGADVIKFLLGEGALNGVWYGDP